MKNKTLRSNKEDTANIKDLLFAVEELTLLVEALQDSVDSLKLQVALSPKVVYIPSQPIIIEKYSVPVPQYISSTPMWQNPNVILCGSGTTDVSHQLSSGVSGAL